MPLPDVARIVERLGPSSMFGPVRAHLRVASTNAVAAEAARAGAGEGLVVFADEQSAGRGRRDRRWTSQPGAGVAMSALLRPRRPGGEWGWLSLAAGLAVHKAIGRLTEADFVLKWPNDVLVAGAKVCGILSERVEAPDGPAAVVGIGINVGVQGAAPPAPGAGWLADFGVEASREEVAAAVLGEFEAVYAAWSATGRLRQAYRVACGSIGARLRIAVSPRESLAGLGVDVDEAGRLLVAVDGQGVRAFAAGDVAHASLG